MGQHSRQTGNYTNKAQIDIADKFSFLGLYYI